MTYCSTKTFGHDVGISCAFRQWRATSHCNQIHGYALAFKFTFEAEHLDDKNWVVDFGGLKALKEMLLEAFDHKLVVAEDDPQLDVIMELSHAGVADVHVVKAVGCEAFARIGFEMASRMIDNARVFVVSCEVMEHGANSAIYYREEDDE